MEKIDLVNPHPHHPADHTWRGMCVAWHYNDVIMGAVASQITSLTIVYSTVYSGADQTKHQSSASLAFVRGIHRGPVNSPHKWPVSRKMFPVDDVIMILNVCGTFITVSLVAADGLTPICCQYICNLHDGVSNSAYIYPPT